MRRWHITYHLLLIAYYVGSTMRKVWHAIRSVPS